MHPVGLSQASIVFHSLILSAAPQRKRQYARSVKPASVVAFGWGMTGMLGYLPLQPIWYLCSHRPLGRTASGVHPDAKEGKSTRVITTSEWISPSFGIYRAPVLLQLVSQERCTAGVTSSSERP